MDSPELYRHDHPLLGNLTGLQRGPSVVEFRGIPFASIPGRFRQSQLKTTLPSQEFIATNYGPECPQRPTPYPGYWNAPDSGRPEDFCPGPDEYKCLNLSITVPAAVLGDTGLVPVLVWIHGGAFAGGSHAVRSGGRFVYDASDLVNRSIKLKSPIIVVGINYRVGPLGFLASSELAAFNRVHGEPVGNYGLHDQRRAFEWVSKFAAGFGGDKQQITLYGTSAGAASCHYHTISDWERNFQRAILVSATAFGIGPLTEEQHQVLYDKYTAVLGLQGDSAGLLSHLRRLPVEDLIDVSHCSTFGPLFRPVIDGSFINSPSIQRQSNRTIPGPDLMLGSCTYEQEVVEAMRSDNSYDMDLVRLSIDSNSMIADPGGFLNPDILSTYNIDSSSLCRATPYGAAVELAGDAMFRCPPYYTALYSASRCLFFDFQAVNPYPKAGKNHRAAHHGVNDLFVFNPAPDLVPQDDQENWNMTIRHVQKTWISFCYANLPWAAFDGEKEGPVYIFADGGQSSEAKTLQAALGRETTEKWRAVLVKAEG